MLTKRQQTTQMINRLCEIAKGIEENIKVWENMLTELNTDLAAQEKMIAQPFAKQQELDQKRLRFNEIMTELNPPEEQQMSEDESDQAQSRKYLEDDKKKKYNKQSYYSQSESSFLSWSNSVDPIEKVKKFNRFGKIRFYEKTENGCVEISKSQYNERKGFNAEDIDRKAERGFSKIANQNGSSERGQVDNSISYRDSSGIENISKQAFGEQLRNDTERSISSSGRFDLLNLEEDEQYQTRTGTLSNIDVLEIAARELDTTNFTDGEKAALEIAQNRIVKVRDLQTERVEQGKLYKEQQFGAMPNRNAAQETLNRMKVLD